MGNRFIEAVEALAEKRTYARYLFLEEAYQETSPANKLKVAVLRNYTTEMLTPVIGGEIALMGEYPCLYTGEYDNVQQEILDENSQFYQFDPHMIILALWMENLSPKLYKEFNALTSQEIRDERDRILSELETSIAVLRQRSSAAILVHNFIYPDNSTMGILDLQTEDSQLKTIQEINGELYRILRQYRNVYVVDIVSVFYQLGYNHAYDSKSWATSKNPFTKEALVHIGMEYGKFIKVLRGQIKKCIILDCDNTLWGGIAGELGSQNIKIGETYPGLCYKELQREILNLYHRGIMVALCSKNNEADVLEVFHDNEEMLLQTQHLAAYRINWTDKVENIREIAHDLNIGLDSLVFVDDSAFECNLIRQFLPEVEVIHLDMEPSHYAAAIRNCGLFNALTLTEDDKNRNQSYQAETVRKKMKKNASSIDEYLAGLHIQATLRRNCLKQVGRIAQLTQKTNQFNLTTKRYNEEEIQYFMMDASYDVISVSLKDAISDLGLIGVAILHYQGDVVVFDTFLLSCRGLGRKVEDVLFKVSTDIARMMKCEYMYAVYRKTQKNEQVSTFYDKYNVEQIEKDTRGNVAWKGRIPHIFIPEYIAIEVS